MQTESRREIESALVAAIIQLGEAGANAVISAGVRAELFTCVTFAHVVRTVTAQPSAAGEELFLAVPDLEAYRDELPDFPAVALVPYYAMRLREEARADEVRRALTDAVAKIDGNRQIASAIAHEAAEALSAFKDDTGPQAGSFKTFADLGPLIPEDNDPDVLFRNNWMGRGGGLIITSSSGVGKSSALVQAALNWVMGRTFIGVPIRPLSVAIIQSEDSRRDMQEQVAGMRKGLVEIDGWTDVEVAEALRRLHFWESVGRVGDDFIEWLKAQHAADPVDIICINPIQGFFGGDVSAQEDASHFLREGLDPILKGSHPCMAVLVQHTPKIKSGETDGRANVDDYGEYIGAGTHEWTDWARAMVVFLKRGKSDTVFSFKASKRGRRIGWKDDNGETVTSLAMRHADGFIFWQRATAEEVEEADVTSSTTKRKDLDAERKAGNDEGPQKNALRLVECVRNGIKAGQIVTISLVRTWAGCRQPGDPPNIESCPPFWAKGVARDAMREFSAIREDHGIILRRNGEFVLV